MEAGNGFGVALQHWFGPSFSFLSYTSLSVWLSGNRKKKDWFAQSERIGSMQPASSSLLTQVVSRCVVDDSTPLPACTHYTYTDSPRK